MTKASKKLIVALQRTRGERDAALGVSQQSASPSYREGYAHQYAKAEMQSGAYYHVIAIPF